MTLVEEGVGIASHRTAPLHVGTKCAWHIVDGEKSISDHCCSWWYVLYKMHCLKCGVIDARTTIRASSFSIII